MTVIDWSSLRHAYGPATDVPALLARARSAAPPSGYRDEPWFTLWSSLYHQDDVYSASYAAVPELVAIASDCGPEIAAESLFLAASIELRRNEPGAPAVPAKLAVMYDQALAMARPLATELLQHMPDRDGKLDVAAAVFGGDLERARALLDADEEQQG